MTGESSDRGPAVAEPPTAAQPKVLVVDDSPVERRVAGRVLADRGGIEVVYAADGVEALSAIERETPDAVLTDMQMPNMDGLTLVEEVRRQFPLVPTILMTAHGSEEVALAALQRGAASYVPKRNLARDLVETMRNVLAVARSDRQQRRLLQCWSRTDFHFCLDNDASLVPLLVVHLQQYLRGFRSCDETELIRVGVALHEALSNAIHHGNLELSSELRGDGSDAYYDLAQERRELDPYRARKVHVTAQESHGEGRYVIRDEGPGFDTSAALPDPTDPANLQRPSGRGLFLIRTFMHEVRHNQQGNEITLIHRRQSTAN